MKNPICLVGLATVFALPARVPAQPDFISGLAGDWAGSLTYVDFGTGQRVELPARAVLDAVPGASQLVAHLAISDPGREVHTLEVISLDLDAETLVTHSFEGPRALLQTYRIAERSYADRQDWMLELSGSGLDGGRPAEFRDRRTLIGSRFVVSHEVRYTDEGEDAEWFLRNELMLERPEPDPTELVGTWLVDLGSGATTELKITAADERALEGSFYSTPMGDGLISLGGSSLHVAFVTADDSGPYNSQAELMPDGTLRGTTHSLGRDFLSVWTAARRR